MCALALSIAKLLIFTPVCSWGGDISRAAQNEFVVSDTVLTTVSWLPWGKAACAWQWPTAAPEDRSPCHGERLSRRQFNKD